MSIYNKFKKYILELNVKEKSTNLVMIVIVAAIVLIAASVFIGEDKNTVKDGVQTIVTSDISNVEITNQYERALKKELEEILGKIKGVGKVDVMITLKSTSEVVLAQDVTTSDRETNEKDSAGGARIIKENQVSSKTISSKGSGSDIPFVTKELSPEIQGVIVVAEGANDPNIRMTLFEAVRTVLDLPGNKVKVFPK